MFTISGDMIVLFNRGFQFGEHFIQSIENCKWNHITDFLLFSLSSYRLLENFFKVVTQRFFNFRYLKQMCFEVGDFMFELKTNYTIAVAEYNQAYNRLIKHLEEYRKKWEKLSDTYYQ